MNSTIIIWKNIWCLTRYRFENLIYKLLIYHLIIMKNIKVHVKHIYLTAYIAWSYLPYSLMYDKKSSICNRNVCISISFVHVLLGKWEKGSMLFWEHKQKRLDTINTKTLYNDAYRKNLLVVMYMTDHSNYIIA